MTVQGTNSFALVSPAPEDGADGPDFSIEAAIGRARIAGIDEAGRGPWAGPVVAAAVVLPAGRCPEGLNDSKLLTAHARGCLYEEILACADVGVGMADVEEIARNNLLGATFHAMQRALAALRRPPHAAIVDGPHAPALPCHAHAVIKGDRRSLSVAAASIVAKVARDTLMLELAEEFPGYGWERNKGYGSPEHAEGITRLGVTQHHRLTFKPVQALLSRNGTGTLFD
ncbi:MAG: ribonuclease HII [bacterium]